MTNDPHVGPLFRQLLSSEDANTRQLAALGCGLIRDEKSVTELTKLINDIIPAVSRSACLALVAIGDKNALETVATVLIQGSEMVQRYAAEALANHIEEGHPALRDGSKMDDLLIRRAVIFGLARINEPWADEILENLQLEDQQWLVRNAAIQALEERNRPKPYLPTPSGPLTDMTWLIEFASKLGIGVAPGKPAVDLLIRALRDGDEELRLAVLNYLQVNGIEEVIPIIVNVYRGSLGEVREAAFNTLWHLSASGYEINIQS
jgi:HEAT repeat protein